MTHKNISLLYFIVLIVEIVAAQYESQLGIWLLKTLLMPILVYIVWKRQEKGVYKNLLWALFFSWLGDVLLIQFSFELGLAAFLIAHLFYIKLFYKESRWSYLKLLLFFILPAAYYVFLFPHITPALKIPVLLYCGVISTMAAMAFFRDLKIKSNKWVSAGAMLFVLSDGLIAHNKFVSPIPMSAFWVMASYGLAQYLIVTGWIKKEF